MFFLVLVNTRVCNQVRLIWHRQVVHLEGQLITYKGAGKQSHLQGHRGALINIDKGPALENELIFFCQGGPLCYGRRASPAGQIQI